MGKLSSKCWRPPVKGGPVNAEFTMSYITGPHLDTGQWLKKLDLKEYSHIFKSYNGVEDILSMSERELKTLGVKNGSHRARMMTSIIVLRDKYERADSLIRSVTAPSSVRHSLVHSRDSLHSSPCFRSRRLSVPVSRRSSARLSMEPMTATEASPEELKKALEWELSLDNSDLRSHAWYHGTIPRLRAEELMSEEGDFLIRDCISRPGDYVLTCRWRSTSLHFVINKVVFQPFTVYERIQYQFEDDCFDTVPDLVTYYVGNKRPISAASGAVISRPVNRSMPLSYYATRYGLECQMHYAALALEKVAGSQESLSEKCAHGGSGESLNQERRMSQPSDVSKLKEDAHPSGVSTMPRSASNDYPRKSLPNFSTLQHGGLHSKSAGSPMSLEKKGLKQKSSQENVPDVFISKEESKDDTPPPKPSRIPSKKYSTSPSVNVTSGNKSSSNDAPPHLYSELNFINKPLNGNIQRLDGTETKNHDWSSTSLIKFDQRDGQNTPNRTSREITIPEVDPPSSFDLESFTTVMLQTENKPLDPQALAKMRCMLLEGGAKVIASHLTKVDLDVLRLSQNEDLGLGVLTGFELLVLPQGQQLRLDLLERTESLKYFVAITILTCGDEVRAQVLNKWIQIAIETKTALGNLYGFTGIMQGLALSQISRLRCTWLKLRQTCTENAFTYETKLRPTIKNMQECSNPQAPNTCIPYVLSLIVILQRHLDHLSGQDFIEDNDEKIQNAPLESLSTSNKEKGKVLSLGLQWEQTAADYGLQLLLTHLEIGRTVTQQWPMYKRNSEIVLEHVKYDDLMLDMFRTEFQMKFLWGSKGCHVVAKERYSKLVQVLNVMSERCEPD